MKNVIKLYNHGGTALGEWNLESEGKLEVGETLWLPEGKPIFHKAISDVFIVTETGWICEDGKLVLSVVAEEWRPCEPSDTGIWDRATADRRKELRKAAGLI